MANGKWVGGGRAKGMDSALWYRQGEGMPGRGGLLAAAEDSTAIRGATMRTPLIRRRLAGV